jgi:sterol desaturase/sphingolipid hydroxylase (fatty acid hydroxylase superfamily)
VTGTALLGPIARFGLAAFALIALTVAEDARPLRRVSQAKWRRRAINVAFIAVGAASLALLYGPIVLGVEYRARHAGFGLLRSVHLPAWARGALGFVLLDYTLWVWHLLNHRLPLLWRFHAAHHVDLDLDVSTALRFHLGELLLSLPFRALQVAVIGVDAPVLLAWETVLIVATEFHHSNLRLPRRFEHALRLLLVTPPMHGIHHSIVAGEVNSNFGTLFTVWDRLHHTLVQDVPQEQIVIGLAEYGTPRGWASLPRWHSRSLRASDPDLSTRRQRASAIPDLPGQLAERTSPPGFAGPSCLGNRRFRERIAEVYASRAFDDPAVEYVNDAIHFGDHPRVVGDDQDCGLPLGAQLAQETHDAQSALGVEGGSRFVGEQHLRLIRQRPGDGDPLLLSSGKLVRPVLGAIGDPEIVEKLHRTARRLAAADPHQIEREHHVLPRREKRNQVRKLENEPDLLPSQALQIPPPASMDVVTVEHDAALGRLGDEPEDGEESRLSRAARSHDREQLAAPHCEADPLERLDAGGAFAEDLDQVCGLDDEPPCALAVHVPSTLRASTLMARRIARRLLRIAIAEITTTICTMSPEVAWTRRGKYGSLAFSSNPPTTVPTAPISTACCRIML